MCTQINHQSVIYRCLAHPAAHPALCTVEHKVNTANENHSKSNHPLSFNNNILCLLSKRWGCLCRAIPFHNTSQCRFFVRADFSHTKYSNRNLYMKSMRQHGHCFLVCSPVGFWSDLVWMWFYISFGIYWTVRRNNVAGLAHSSSHIVRFNNPNKNNGVIANTRSWLKWTGANVRANFLLMNCEVFRIIYIDRLIKLEKENFSEIKIIRLRMKS